MSQHDRTSPDIRGRIVTSLFETIEPDDAVAMAGIMFEYRIVLSRQYWALLGRPRAAFPLEPLEPTEACTFVADLYHMDCDELFRSFHKKWSTLKDSPRVKALVSRIESHAFVDRLERWSSTA